MCSNWKGVLPLRNGVMFSWPKNGKTYHDDGKNN